MLVMPATGSSTERPEDLSQISSQPVRTEVVNAHVRTPGKWLDIFVQITLLFSSYSLSHHFIFHLHVNRVWIYLSRWQKLWPVLPLFWTTDKLSIIGPPSFICRYAFDVSVSWLRSHNHWCFMDLPHSDSRCVSRKPATNGRVFFACFSKKTKTCSGRLFWAPIEALNKNNKTNSSTTGQRSLDEYVTPSFKTSSDGSPLCMSGDSCMMWVSNEI